jgi:hypothetical protein
MSQPASSVAGRQIIPLYAQSARGGAYKRDDGKEVEIPLAVLVKASFTDPAAAVTNGIVTSHAGASSAGTTTLTPNGGLASGGVATLTPARNVVITVTHASSVVAMSGVITGTRLGRVVTEAWSVTATGTTKTFTGAVAFDTVTSITEVVAANASANTIIMGSGNVLGLVGKCAVASAVKEIAAGSVVTNGTVVAASSSANADARGTYAPNTVPNGSNDYAIWYIADDLSSIY